MTVGNSLVNPKENLQRQEFKMLAHDVKNLLISLYGSLWLLLVTVFIFIFASASLDLEIKLIYSQKS